MAKSNRIAAVVLGMLLTGAGLLFADMAIMEIRIRQAMNLQVVSTFSVGLGMAMIILPRGILSLLVGVTDYTRWDRYPYIILAFCITQLLGTLCLLAGAVCFLVHLCGAW